MTITFEPLDHTPPTNEVQYPTNEPMVRRELFAMPIFEKRFAGHAQFKESVIGYLTDDENYKDNTLRSTLKFTHPNLHRDPLFRPIVDFFNEALTETFNSLGFKPSFEITGIWATRHGESGYHHRHIHMNSFLGGVYYLKGSPTAPGTTFFSDWKSPTIVPAVSDVGKKKFDNEWRSFFEEGKLIIFPSWMEHSTDLNKSNDDRIILSFNCMPVGKTNNDPFDRYNYQSVQNAEMINYRSEKFK